MYSGNNATNSYARQMILIPSLPHHFKNIKPQKEQAFINKYMQDISYVETLCFEHESWTGVVDGNVKFIAGVIRPHDHIAMLWAVLSDDSSPYMLHITRKIKNWINAYDCCRIETCVRHDFKEGHRWAKMLGFKDETPNGMEKFGVDGESYHLYARVK